MSWSLERCEKCGKFHTKVHEEENIGPQTFYKELPKIVPECEDKRKRIRGKG